jgi:glycosyltransferase involved in cell wall biosynthesis
MPIPICIIGLRGLPFVIGGIEAHCQHLYPRLRRLGKDLRMTFLIRKGYTEQTEFLFEGMRVRALWSPRIWGVDTLIHTFASLIFARVFVHPQIVHLHGIGVGFFAPLARIFGFVTIVTHHAQDYERPKWDRRGRLFLKLGEWFTARTAHAIICVSEALREHFLALYPAAASRTHVIRHAGGLPDANRPNFSPVLDELNLAPRSYILAVGRLEGTKAFDDLIEAFRRARLGDRKLVIVGSAAGNEESAANLMKMASAEIIFAGFQTGDALRRLYEEALLFVHPSHMEGYALVVAEALSTGIPAIVTDIPPHREFGLRESCYYRAGDVDALALMLGADDYARYLSPEASARVREDSWDRVAREHLDLICALITKDR